MQEDAYAQTQQMIPDKGLMLQILEIDGALDVLGLRQYTSIRAHDQVALHMQMMVVRVPCLHLEPDGRVELEPQLGAAGRRLRRQLRR